MVNNFAKAGRTRKNTTTVVPGTAGKFLVDWYFREDLGMICQTILSKHAKL